MRLNPINSSILFAIFVGIIAAGCSNTYHDEIDRGAGYEYRPGYPELRLAATGFVDELDNSYIVVSGDIVYGSLVYSGKDGIYKAEVSIELQINNTESENVVLRENYSETILGENQNILHSQNVQRFEYQYEVQPGEYNVQVVVTDETSGRQTSRTTETSIPNPGDNNSHITEIRLLGKDSSSRKGIFNQATTYDIPSRLDSLKFVFQVTNNNPEEPIEIETRLLKFEADSSAARPMNYVNYSPSSLAYIGIDFDKFDIIQSSSRTLSQPGSVIIELAFDNLERGNYRLEVISNEGEDNELYKGRAFGIKSPSYPSLKTAKELAQPLAYLMNEKDYDKLMSIKDSDSLKNAVDRFWLSNIKNSRIAKEVISLYYRRVEEANKQFSNYKEGWKTDPGMVYILFGPPWYNDVFADRMVWSYSYNMNDFEKTFAFERYKRKTKFYPFSNYMLQRSSGYYSIHYSQVEKWKSGLILRDNL